MKTRMPTFRADATGGSATAAPSKAARDYGRLVCEWMPRPIADEAAYEAASDMVDRLAVRAEDDLSEGERAYLDTVAALIEAYDAEHLKPAKPMKPLAALKHLMRESGTTQAELAAFLGNRATASLILSGKRQMSKTHIRKLADHFKVDSSLFLGTATFS